MAEMAILLPLFVMIVLVCVDFGRFAHTYIAVTNGARAGAGYAIMHPFTNATQSLWEAAVRQAVIDEMNQMSRFDPTQLTVTATRTIENTGLWRVRVEVRYPFQTFVEFIDFPLFYRDENDQPFDYSNPPRTLRKVVVMRGIR